MRAISTPEGTFFYNRSNGTCIYTDIKKSKEWQKPLYTQIALTTKCNLHCWHCYNQPNNTSYKWPLNKLKQLIQYLDKWGIFGVSFGGGEPFLYPYLCEVAQFTWKQTGLDVSLTTSGYAAKEDQIKALEGCVSEIRVSIRSPNDVSQLSKFLDHRFEVGVNLLLYKNNTSMLEELIRACRTQGVCDFLVNSFVAIGGGAGFADKIPTKKDYTAFAELLNRYTSEKVTFKVSGRLSSALQLYSFLPFSGEMRGRILSITADGKLKPASITQEAYPFIHIEQIAPIYRQKIIRATQLSHFLK